MLTLLLGSGTTDASTGKEDIWAVMWMSGEAAEEMEACTDAQVRSASSLAYTFSNICFPERRLVICICHSEPCIVWLSRW